MTDEPILPKAYYAMGEVCDLTGLKPHVLRYWETQFEALRPTKNRAGNRVYRPREVELVLLVKHLLYEEKFTIDGARKRIREMRRGGGLDEERQEVAGPELFQVMKEELQHLQEILTLPDPPPPPPGGGNDRGHSSPRPSSSPAPSAPSRESAQSEPSEGGTSSASPDPRSPDDPFPQLHLDVDDS